MNLSRFAKYAWGVLAFNLCVIMWGAYVRASSSGAGCGSHWPLCNGEIIPREPTIKTLIEFSHRLTSGLALLLTIGLLVWAFRTFAKKHPARTYAALSMLFMLLEAAIGAGLVLFEYVAENKSIGRALWMSGHLINTFLMVATLTLTAWTASTVSQAEVSEPSQQKSLNWIFLAAIIGTLILGVSGAVTALGGTLFPVASLAEGLKQDLSPTSHVLIRLRFYHPFIAVGVGALLILTAAMARGAGDWGRRLSTSLIALVLIQLGAGLANLLLHAPIWLQIIHLLLSDLVWIALVLLAFTARSQPARETAFNAAKPIPGQLNQTTEGEGVMATKHPALLDRRRAVLAVIDMQEAFRPIISWFDVMVERIALLVQAANLLKLPVIVTEQYPNGLGRTVEEISRHLPDGSEPIEKLTFSACGVQEFDLRLREFHAEQVIICGIEAHICVSQTAHDLIQNSYQVHLLSDAVSARLPRNLDVAINKIAKAGAVISSVEMALFELCPAGTPEFKQMQSLVKLLK